MPAVYVIVSMLAAAGASPVQGGAQLQPTQELHTIINHDTAATTSTQTADSGWTRVKEVLANQSKARLAHYHLFENGKKLWREVGAAKLKSMDEARTLLKAGIVPSLATNDARQDKYRSSINKLNEQARHVNHYSHQLAPNKHDLEQLHLQSALDRTYHLEHATGFALDWATKDHPHQAYESRVGPTTFKGMMHDVETTDERVRRVLATHRITAIRNKRPSTRRVGGKR